MKQDLSMGLDLNHVQMLVTFKDMEDILICLVQEDDPLAVEVVKIQTQSQPNV